MPTFNCLFLFGEMGELGERGRGGKLGTGSKGGLLCVGVSEGVSGAVEWRMRGLE